jgi:hypothetical protein
MASVSDVAADANYLIDYGRFHSQRLFHLDRVSVLPSACRIFLNDVPVCAEDGLHGAAIARIVSAHFHYHKKSAIAPDPVASLFFDYLIQLIIDRLTVHIFWFTM